jgi:uncharacterized protein
MIVVSNTSPLTNLAAIGQITLLNHLYKQLYIAEGVWEELNAQGRRWPGRDEVAEADWIQRYPVENQTLVRALQADLDRGEAETIALALEIGADLVLLDERDARSAAKRQGLRVAGVVGVLLVAKKATIIAEVRPHLDALRQVAGFYVSQSLYQHTLELAEETDN